MTKIKLCAYCDCDQYKSIQYDDKPICEMHLREVLDE